MKVVVNRCYGGFGLSEKALRLLQQMGVNINVDEAERLPGSKDYILIDINNKTFGIESENELQYRTNPKLIEVIERIKKESFGPYSELEIVEIPDDVDWDIEEYDGYERVVEKHRSW